MAISAGAPPRLGQGHPNSAARRPDPPVTELPLFSPKGKGADDPHLKFHQIQIYLVLYLF